MTTWEDICPRPALAALLDGRSYLAKPPAAFVKRLLLPAGAESAHRRGEEEE